MKIYIITLSMLLALFSTHYLEEKVLPFVLEIRSIIFGEQVYDNAKKDFKKINKDKWIHPATLSLTAYGRVHETIDKYNTDGLPEVLQNYRDSIISNEDMILIANYLLENSKLIKKNGKIFARYVDYPIKKPIYNLTKPWVSGLAQSFIGQVFLGSYESTKNIKYLNAAKEVANFLTIPVKDGGVLVVLDKENYWFEEYAEKDSIPPLVLNGHLLTLDFLYFLNKIEYDKKWSLLFRKGLNAAINNIDKFVGNNWSYYDQKLNFANGKYHRFHIKQLKRYEIFDTSGKLTNAKVRMEKQLLMPFGTIDRLINQPSNLLVGIYISFLLLYITLSIVLLFIYKKLRSNLDAN